MRKTATYLGLCLLITACSTYYMKNRGFQENLLSGQLEKADKLLENDKKADNKKNKVLYCLNRGYINWLLQNHEKSNDYFSQADIIIEDQLKELGKEIIALATNPNVKPYKPEDFEIVLINFFKSLNYVSINDYEAALVEAKKINIKLNNLNDKYPKHKNRYGNDAFAHLVMALLYEANDDQNNAFIAYRNALGVYATDYNKNYNTSVPEQLKKDLMRSAYQNGFYVELEQYQTQFDMKYQASDKKTELVFFWLNGLGPVKAERNILFAALPGGDGIVHFNNQELGLTFPVFLGNNNPQEKAAFSDLKVIRIAFPKYVERKPVYNSAKIKNNNGLEFKLETAQNINEIAFKTLHDRMVREISNSIGRIAAKKAMEAAVSKKNANLGTVMGIANAITEKADTRNWQTLPHSISYARIPLDAGENELSLTTFSKTKKNTTNFNIVAREGETYFFYFHSLDSYDVDLLY